MRDTPGLLRPSKVTIISSHKTWGGDRDSGTSGGSEFHLECEIDLTTYPDLTPMELKRAVLEEKRRLDLLALDTEYLRGTLPHERYTREREVIKDRYGRVLAVNESTETMEDLR